MQLAFLPEPTTEECEVAKARKAEARRRTLQALLTQPKRRSKEKVPRQLTARLRERRPNAPYDIRRRTHDRGTDAHCYSEQGIIDAHIALFRQSIKDLLLNDDVTDLTVAETWAWIDRARPHEPFSFQTCLEFFCIEESLEPDWVRQSLEAHRPIWLTHLDTNPAAYGLYVFARYLS